ncbi:chitin synthase [Malassezia caprae]|uniref:Chitin synthase n=1 Tax=Malassezia caprae TaxID=1381934 RepID=A0AAF0E574_9BASI|nr:chitin synthase [Malassezia caprae]
MRGGTVRHGDKTRFNEAPARHASYVGDPMRARFNTGCPNTYITVMPVRAFFGPRRVVTTPAASTAPLYDESELEQEQLINPYESQAPAYDETQNIVDDYEYLTEETYKQYHDTGAGADAEHNEQLTYPDGEYQYPAEIYYDNALTVTEHTNEPYNSPPTKSEMPYLEPMDAFSHMRYTALTCDPDRFASEQYSLRQVLYNPPRPTEICIILTLYNEDDKLFTRTMHGVMTNIAYLCSLKNHATWGPDSWKKVSVVIIADGRMKIHSRVLSVLAAMGIYQEGVGKNTVQDVPVVAHMYEYTTQISVDPSLKFRSAERGIVPVQVLLCIKEHNQKKINSHRWAFNAFSAILQPRICVLIDVGTKPKPRSIYRLWETFDRDENVGGACGEIVALKGKMGHALANPLVAAQNFEYKLSNVLDKPMESAFGYINVLPGAFSAYRYEALQNDAMGHGPLSTYFKGEKLYGGHSNADIFTKNMYLAEDRVLCWELVTKRNASFINVINISVDASGDAVNVTLPNETQDIDAAYEDACHVLAAKPEKITPTRDLDLEQKDYYAAVRTNVLLAWTLTNAALAVAIINLPRNVHNIYMAILFYAVAGLAFFRFIGTIFYLCLGP